MTTAEPHDHSGEGVASDVASWLATEMRAACEEPVDSSLSSDSAIKAIKECAQLLSHVWPVGCTSSEHLRPDRSVECLDAQSMSPLKGDERLGRFEIRKQLGYGGFGVVFLAYDPHLGRDAALKIPRPEILVSSQLRQRFLREAHAAALLDHPGIVPIYETGEIGPVTYILSAYCKGPTLAAWLKERADPATASIAARVTACLADAVQHAHDRGVLHRDLKPANVLLDPGEGLAADFSFYPRLSDFGLAKRIESTNDFTQAGALLGTPRYMAPEQARGDERSVGVQTDVYSLGVILYELLAEAPPIIGGTDLETLRKIEEQEPSAAPLRDRAVPIDLETICLKCLEKSPARRYQSARDLAEDLRRFLAGDPVLARPIGKPKRFVRWCRRRPVTAALSFGLILAVCAGTIAATSQWLRAESNLAAAVKSGDEAKRNLRQAENTLLDFAWIIEESTLWSEETVSLRNEIDSRLKRYYENLEGSQDNSGNTLPIQAALHSFAARSGALNREPPELVDEEFLRALALWHKVVAANPKAPEYRRALALCLFSYSTFVRDHARRTGAVDPMGEVRKVITTTAQAQPHSAHVLSDLATMLLERGNVHFNAREEKEARDAHEVGLVAAQELIRQHPNSADYVFLTAILSRVVANDRRRDNDRVHALEAIECARELLEPLVANDPSNRQLNEEMAETYRLLGYMERNGKQYQVALKWLGQAVALCDKLASEKPDQSSLVRLATSLENIASVHAALDQRDEALDALLRCRDVLHEARKLGSLPDLQIRRLGQICHRLGKLANELSKDEVARSAFADGAAAYDDVATRVDFSAEGILAHAECHAFLASHQALAGEQAAAITSYEVAVKLLEHNGIPPADPRFKDRYRKTMASLNELRSQQ